MSQPQKSEEVNQKQKEEVNKPQQSQPYDKQQFEKQFQMHEQQQKMIREQIQAESPLIGDQFVLSQLMKEFINNQGFYIKLENLLNKYSKYRKTRRDGSCFYRALLYCVFERIILDKNVKLKDHMMERIKYSKEHLLAAKFEGLIFEDLQEAFLEKLSTKCPQNEQELLKMFRNAEESNYLVLMMRFLTSGELRNNAILYETFIDEQIPIQMFCQMEVEPIDKEADQIQIMALLNYLNVAIKIVYLDANMNKEAYNVILPENMTQKDVVAELLYRPGHYDILYK